MAQQPKKTDQMQADVPRERLEFRRLLLAGKGAAQAAGNTTYEELTCIGFNPALDLLEGTVQIKRPNGYLGTLCTPGSTEFVRFYVDYGGGWVDAGLAEFNAHDLPNLLDCAEGDTIARARR